MVIAVRVGLVLVSLLRNVDFAPDDRMYPFRDGRVIELDCSEKIAVVGHRDGRHLQILDRLHETANFARAIKERVVSVTVQVNERGIRHELTYGRGGGLAFYCNFNDVW